MKSVLALASLVALVACAKAPPDQPAAPPAANQEATGKADASSSKTGNLVCLAVGAPILVFNAKEGETCCYDSNCKSGLICSDYRCQPRADEGERCSRTSDCQPGLECVDGHCGSVGLTGDACTTSAGCKGHLVCTVAAVCGDLADDGTACTSSDQCTSQRCNDGLCTTPFPRGAPCSSDLDCETGLTCQNGACEEPPASGNACARDSEVDECVYAETCWDGVCVNRRQAGETCETVRDCKLTLDCVDGVCRTP